MSGDDRAEASSGAPAWAPGDVAALRRFFRWAGSVRADERSYGGYAGGPWVFAVKRVVRDGHVAVCGRGRTAGEAVDALIARWRELFTP